MLFGELSPAIRGTETRTRRFVFVDTTPQQSLWEGQEKERTHRRQASLRFNTQRRGRGELSVLSEVRCRSITVQKPRQQVCWKRYAQDRSGFSPSDDLYAPFFCIPSHRVPCVLIANPPLSPCSFLLATRQQA